MKTVTDSAKLQPKQKQIFLKIPKYVPYVSVFDHKKDNQPERTKLTWEMTKHNLRTKKDGEMFNASKFDGTRGDNNFVSANAIYLDFDKGKPST